MFYESQDTILPLRHTGQEHWLRHSRSLGDLFEVPTGPLYPKRHQSTSLPHRQIPSKVTLKVIFLTEKDQKTVGVRFLDVLELIKRRKQERAN